MRPQHQPAVELDAAALTIITLRNETFLNGAIAAQVIDYVGVMSWLT